METDQLLKYILSGISLLSLLVIAFVSVGPQPHVSRRSLCGCKTETAEDLENKIKASVKDWDGYKYMYDVENRYSITEVEKDSILERINREIVQYAHSSESARRTGEKVPAEKVIENLVT